MTGRKAIHFGAGNIGRGFIGPLLTQSGYHVVFADVDKQLINNINQLGKYDVHILEGENSRGEAVSDFSGVMSTTDDIVKEIADPDVKIITTSVGVSVLAQIAATIAKGIQERRRVTGEALNVIACENTIGATTQLAKGAREHFSDDDKEYVARNVGWANCSVDRIVPPFEHDSALDVGVEGFYEWIVEREVLKGLNEQGSLGVQGMVLTDDLDGYVERKLFTLNTGHAIAAYLGFVQGYETIDESMQHEEILQVVRGAMHESGAALMKKHTGFHADEHAKYIQKIEERFKNPNVRDDVKRVGRQPLRKLGRGDRLLGPTYMAQEYGLPIDNLAQGIAAAFLYENEHDEQAVELQDKIKDVGIEKTVAEVTGFAEGSKEYAKVLKAHRDLTYVLSAG